MMQFNRLFLPLALVIGVATQAAPDTNRLAIDLPTTLQLAGARSLDIQIAREKVAEAKANHETALWQFFPALMPGLGYRRHDDLIQDVAGNVVDVHKDSYTVGPNIVAQVELGDAIYKRLAARQYLAVAESALDTQRQETALAAVQGYFELVRAHAAVRVAAEAVRIAAEFTAQVRQAVAAGIAFKGDALRAEVQTDKNRVTLRQAQEQVTIATARLVQTLHLDARVELIAPAEELAPLTLIATNAALDSLVAQAMTQRPELKRSHASVAGARLVRDGTKYGPLVPSLGAQVFAGGFGGGIDDRPGRFGAAEDYQLTLSWRLGPGGLFDRPRIRASDARLNVARLTDEKLADAITREVIESQARVHSLADQLNTTGHAVQAADEALRLATQRKEFAVGVVLERVQAEQDLTRARLDYLNVASAYNTAQFEALRAVGSSLDLPR